MRDVSPVWQSCRNTSMATPSSGTRVVAPEQNTTYLPSALIEGQ